MVSRIFISYARSDGKAVADEVREKITAKGLSVYQDLTSLPAGTADWWRGLTTAIDTVEHVILVMTPGALASEIVRKEWRYARQQGKNVIPLTDGDPGALDTSTLAGWMRRADFVDRRLPERWTRLLHDLERSPDIRRVPLMAEAPPSDFVPRPDEFDALKRALLKGGEPVAITAALKGAGRYGKTTLAKALCADDDIQDAFADGILWVTLGETPGDLLPRLDDLIQKVSGSRSGLTTIEAAASHLEELLADRRIMIVIDDLWQEADAKPFLRGGAQCARLITTRNADTLPQGASETPVDAMELSQAAQLLGVEGADPVKVEALAKRMGEWALLLKLANRVIQNRIKAGADPDDALAFADKALSKKGLTAFDPKNPAERNAAVASTIAVSLDLLEPDERKRYLELAIFPEDYDIPIQTVARLWQATADLDDFDSENLLTRLHNASLLLSLDLATRRLRLHDVFRTYIVEQLGEHARAETEARLLASYRQSTDGKWHHGPNDGYFYERLPAMLWVHDEPESNRLLRHPDWLERKIETLGITPVIGDYPEPAEDLAPIKGALTLSAHVLAEEAAQFRPQMAGRLPATDFEPTLEPSPNCRLHPSRQSLTPPGGPLIRTFEGHSSAVKAVAVLPDGSRAISGSSDKTLKLWDLENGQCLQTLEGHSSWVSALAVLPDGSRAISGSYDKTLKLWDLKSGECLLTLEGHSSKVIALAVLPDGSRAISGSYDKTLKLWDLKSGECLLTLEGHSSTVSALAVLPDGSHAISGSWDQTLKLWDLKSGECLLTLEGHSSHVSALAVLPDGSRAISGSGDKTLKLWDLKSGECLLTLEGHSSWVSALAVLPDGSRAISGSSDKTLKLWDLESGKCLATFTADYPITACAAVSDARFIAGDAGGNLHYLDLVEPAP